MESVRAWISLFAAFMARLLLCGGIFSWGLFFLYFKEDFQINSFQTTVLFSVLQGLTMGCGLIVPSILQLTSPGKLALMGSLLGVGSLAASSLCYTYLPFLLFFSLGQGLFLGITYVMIPIITAGIFSLDKSHIAITLQHCGDGIGMGLFPILLKWLLTEYTWRQSILIVSGVMSNLILCCTIIIYFKNPPSPSLQFEQKNQNNSAAVMRLETDKNGGLIKPDSTKTTLLLPDDFDEADEYVTPSVRHQSPNTPSVPIAIDSNGNSLTLVRSLSNKLIGVLVVFTIPQVVILFVGSVLDSIAVSTFYTVISPYLTQGVPHSTPHLDAEILSIVGLASIGRLAAVFMNGKLVPRWLIFAIGHGLQGLAYLAFILLPLIHQQSFVFLYLNGVFLGVSTGVTSSLLCCVCQDVCGSELLPYVYSYSMFAWGVGSTVGPSMAGLILDSTGSLRVPMGVASAAFILSATFHLLLGIHPGGGGRVRRSSGGRDGIEEISQIITEKPCPK